MYVYLLAHLTHPDPVFWNWNSLLCHKAHQEDLSTSSLAVRYGVTSVRTEVPVCASSLESLPHPLSSQSKIQLHPEGNAHRKPFPSRLSQRFTTAGIRKRERAKKTSKLKLS